MITFSISDNSATWDISEEEAITIIDSARECTHILCVETQKRIERIAYKSGEDGEWLKIHLKWFSMK